MPNAIRMSRGDNRTFTLTVKDTSGKPIDLTGALIWFTVKKTLDNIMDDSTAMFTRATANAQGGGEDQIKTTDGGAEIYIVPSNTQNMKLGITYVVDVQVKLGADNVHTVWIGTLILDGDVTRRDT